MELPQITLRYWQKSKRFSTLSNWMGINCTVYFYYLRYILYHQYVLFNISIIFDILQPNEICYAIKWSRLKIIIIKCIETSIYIIFISK